MDTELQTEASDEDQALWSTEQLFVEARRLAVDKDDSRYWDLVGVLHHQATREIWEVCCRLV